MRKPRELDRHLAEALSLIARILANRSPPALGDGDDVGRDDDVDVVLAALRRLAYDATGGLASPSPLGDRPRIESLTARDWLVSEMLAGGKSYKDIAIALDLSLLSVQSRIKQIYMK